jgi:hypothetical protein
VADEPDDSEPSPERQAELRAAYEANVAAGKAPYEDVEFYRLDELQWVIRERVWSGEPVAGGKERANFRGAGLSDVDLSGARLWEANLSSVTLDRANLSGASLWDANLSGANLDYANLSGAHLCRANLCSASLREARLDVNTWLDGVILDSRTRLADVVWNGFLLTHVDWTQVPRLGDEQFIATVSTREERIGTSRDATRAYRQLATALRAQGLNDEADGYTYRAQVLQRRVFWYQRCLGRWMFSLLLALLAGYGYRLWRILAAYGLTLAGCAGVYCALGLPNQEHLSTFQAVANAFQVSLTAIHGRVFLEQFGLGSALAWVAAVESVVGIVIEGVFIAMLVQRFFAR